MWSKYSSSEETYLTSMTQRIKVKILRAIVIRDLVERAETDLEDAGFQYQ